MTIAASPVPPAKYRCLIVDDEPIAHRVLQNYLSENERVAICGHAPHTEAARQFCLENQVDLLLLDIEMPGETGLDFLRSLDRRPVAILTTAHLEHALEGYELGVLDYLVKPIRRERLAAALLRAVEFLDLLQLQSTLLPSKLGASISIKYGNKDLVLPISAVSHVQGLKDYAILHTADRRHVVRQTMKNLAELLEPFGFVRVHKSFIVAPDKLDLVIRNRIEFDGFVVPVGRRFRAGGG